MVNFWDLTFYKFYTRPFNVLPTIGGFSTLLENSSTWYGCLCIGLNVKLKHILWFLKWYRLWNVYPNQKVLKVVKYNLVFLSLTILDLYVCVLRCFVVLQLCLSFSVRYLKKWIYISAFFFLLHFLFYTFWPFVVLTMFAWACNIYTLNSQLLKSHQINLFILPHWLTWLSKLDGAK